VLGVDGFAVAPDAELGERDLRWITPGGISNRVPFFSGALPAINDAVTFTAPAIPPLKILAAQ
jgi:hypothetical protein